MLPDLSNFAEMTQLRLFTRVEFSIESIFKLCRDLLLNCKLGTYLKIFKRQK